MKPSDQAVANAYAPLFDLLQNEHSLILTESEMDEVIRASDKVKENIDTLYGRIIGKFEIVPFGTISENKCTPTLCAKRTVGGCDNGRCIIDGMEN